MAERYDQDHAGEQWDDEQQGFKPAVVLPPCYCVICAEDQATSDPNHIDYELDDVGVPEPRGNDDEADDEHAAASGWFDQAAIHVRRTGWTSIGILPGMRTPGWAFSVGLWHTYRTPELAIFGLLLPGMQHLVNRAGRLIRDSKPFGLDIEVDGVLETQPVVARTVHPAWYPRLFGFGTGFYRGEVPPFAQLVWADSHGLFPWQRGCGALCRTAQPQLWLAPELHPPGPWQDPE